MTFMVMSSRTTKTVAAVEAGDDLECARVPVSPARFFLEGLRKIFDSSNCRAVLRWAPRSPDRLTDERLGCVS